MNVTHLLLKGPLLLCDLRHVLLLLAQKLDLLLLQHDGRLPLDHLAKLLLLVAQRLELLLGELQLVLVLLVDLRGVVLLLQVAQAAAH